MSKAATKTRTISNTQKQYLPAHIAFIPDGNRRWAKMHSKPVLEGHKKGYEAIFNIAELAFKRGVKETSFYVFSTENWNRSRDEVQGLMHLAAAIVKPMANKLNKQGVRIRVSGSREGISTKLAELIDWAVDLTKKNKAGTVNFCFNYGGRADILEATKNLIKEGIKPSQINEKTFSEALTTHGMRDVDLLVRTSVARLSGFLPWESVYAELYFAPNLLWPDFNEAQFNKALEFFATRKRNFGA